MAQKYFLHWFVSTLYTIHQQPLWLSNPCGVWWLWLWAYYKGRNPQAENRQLNGCGCWFHSRHAANDEEEAIPGELTDQTKVHLLTWIYPGRGGLQVKFSKADADYDIAMTACDAAQTVPVVVVGDDTDLLVLLLHHFDLGSHNPIYLQTSSKTISIPVLQTSLDPTLSQSILFIHALSGCDTTSRPYGIGKLSAIAKHQALAIHALPDFGSKSWHHWRSWSSGSCRIVWLPRSEPWPTLQASREGHHQFVLRTTRASSAHSWCCPLPQPEGIPSSTIKAGEWHGANWLGIGTPGQHTETM